MRFHSVSALVRCNIIYIYLRPAKDKGQFYEYCKRPKLKFIVFKTKFLVQTHNARKTFDGKWFCGDAGKIL